MKKIFFLSSVMAYLLFLSSNILAVSFERISLSKGSNSSSLEGEKLLFIQTFMKAYENIPLSKFGVKELVPFL